MTVLTNTLLCLTGSLYSQSYALIAGNNEGGPGQADLRFAEEDALRMSAVLTDVGGYDAQHVHVVLGPDRTKLLAELTSIEAELEARDDRGEQSIFLFYYSGHARSNALNIGKEELPLEELRERLLAMPATVKVVMLDACQSGAFSRIKGAEPAQDFSFNSVSRLDTEGIAVMASSSGSELSQESEVLRASYFTHHLSVALRGAADRDRDGRITLAEAYRYAYDRTLISTAATAVGSQHVTLETELKGKGDMVLTHPERASAKLELPATLAANLLVTHAPSQSVVAEVEKVAGDIVRIALPAGDYTSLIRNGVVVKKCSFALRADETLVLKSSTCPEVQVESKGVAKGPVSEGSFWDGWALELGAGMGSQREDGYNQRLVDFGYDPQGGILSSDGLRYSISVVRRLVTYVDLVVSFEKLDNGTYKQQTSDLRGGELENRFDWSSYAAGVHFRGNLPLFDGVLVPYLQAGGGFAWAASELKGERETELGYLVGVAGGLQFMPWNHVGFFGQISATTAPILSNLADDEHDSGGLTLVSGLRGAL